MSASYDENVLELTLEFDRPIAVGGFQGSAVIVRDGTANNTEYEGTAPATLIGPARVLIPLTAVGGAFGPEITLSASALSGIVAVDDGGTWAGVSDLVLPFSA